MAKNEMTDNRYYGKICVKHPEFGGLRRKNSYECVQCLSDKKVKKVSRETLSDHNRLIKEIETTKHEIDAKMLRLKTLHEELERTGREEGDD